MNKLLKACQEFSIRAFGLVVVLSLIAAVLLGSYMFYGTVVKPAVTRANAEVVMCEQGESNGNPR